MKRRAIYLYITGVAAAVAVVALCYLASYQVAMRQFRRQLEDYRAENLAKDGTADIGSGVELSDSSSKAAEILGNGGGMINSDGSLAHSGNGLAGEGEISLDGDGLLAAGTAAGTVTPETQYVLEIYDRDKDHLSTYERNVPAYLVGLNREGVEQYIQGYLADVPLDEFQMGLLSYEVVSFSQDKVVLRKVYDQATVPYQYYLVVERGYLVVYYADKKTVYEYTGIEAKNLPEEEQIRLAYGVFLKDQKELYGLLQGYSS